jgi:hypothetical protein
MLKVAIFMNVCPKGRLPIGSCRMPWFGSVDVAIRWNDFDVVDLFVLEHYGTVPANEAIVPATGTGEDDGS